MGPSRWTHEPRPLAPGASGSPAQIARLATILSRLSGAPTVGALLARGTQVAVAEQGFDRGVIATVEHHVLGGHHSDALHDEASDRLRRRLRATPVPIEPFSAEGEMLRRGARGDTALRDAPSPLASHLGLEHHVLGLIAPRGRPLGLLVLDRAYPDVSDVDWAVAAAYASMLAVALENVIMHARVAELSAELRNLTANTQALLGEYLTAEIAWPQNRNSGRGFPAVTAASDDGSQRLRRVLTEREAEVAARLVLGRSNKEIADEVFLSTETVKGHVGRIFRKLGASNRVEASARIRELLADSD